MALSVALSRISRRTGVPVVLLFLLLGMVSGSEGLGRIAFENYTLTFRLGTVALVLILFDGGLNTSAASVRRALMPATVLATAGVAITAFVVAAAARLVGFTWTEALLLGSVVASTDAATVFSVLRASGLNLRRRVGATLELESGLNDPLAVILSVALTASMMGSGPSSVALLGSVIRQLAIGAAAGFVFGRTARWSFERLHLPIGGLLPVFSLAVAFLAFGVTTLASGSGFLAVYIAGVIVGNGPLPYRTTVFRAHDFAASFGQVLMFLMLGLLAFPSRLLTIGWQGIALALFLVLVARPVAVLLCVVPFRYTLREVTFLAWVGLRGAVPIILATYPVLAGVEGALAIFNVVFFVVVVSVLLQGSSVGWLARRLGLATRVAVPTASLEVESARELRSGVLSFRVDVPLPVCGVAIGEIPLPSTSAIVLVVRADDILPGRADLVLEPGDSVHVVCRPEDRPLIQLMFGLPED